MSDCNETLEELDAFLDGELTTVVVEQIRLHLASCADCLQAFDFHAELRAVIRQRCSSDELPAGLAERIRRCLSPDPADPVSTGETGPRDTARGPVDLATDDGQSLR